MKGKSTFIITSAIYHLHNSPAFHHLLNFFQLSTATYTILKLFTIYITLQLSTTYITFHLYTTNNSFLLSTTYITLQLSTTFPIFQLSIHQLHHSLIINHSSFFNYSPPTSYSINPIFTLFSNKIKKEIQHRQGLKKK
jgi:hypothetical protein